MKVKKGGRERSLVGLGEKGMEIAEELEKFRKANCLQENLGPFIASIYMKNRKHTKRKDTSSLLSMVRQR